MADQQRSAEIVSPATNTTTEQQPAIDERRPFAKKDPNVEVTSDDGLEKGESRSNAGEKPPVKWPSEQPLNVSGLTKLFLNLFDLTLVLLPLLLMAKIIGCILVNNELSDPRTADCDCPYWGTLLIAVNKQLTTVYTVLFVMIVAGFMRRFALYRAQRGDFVANLEQYQASTTMTSALKTVWSLRAFTFQSLCIVVVWCFYYVGSQAVQRELTSVPFTISDVQDTGYLAPQLTVALATPLNNQSDQVRFNTSDAEQYFQIWSSLYSSAILNEVNHPGLPADTWGNVKIPMIEYINKTADSDGWIQMVPVSKQSQGPLQDRIQLLIDTFRGVTGNSAVVAPSSGFVGVPAYILASPEQFTYQMDHSYFGFQCQKLALTPYDIVGELPTSPFCSASANESACPVPSVFINITESELSNRSKTNDYSRPIAAELVVVTGGDSGVYASPCTIHQSFVQAEVSCYFQNCVVQRLRKNPSPRTPGKTAIDVASSNLQKAITAYFPYAPGEGGGGDGENSVDILQDYLDLQPTNPLEAVSRYERNAQFDQINATALSVHITQLINSYLTIILASNQIVPSVNSSDITFEDFLTFDTTHSFTKVQAQTSQLSSRFKISPIWIAFDFFTCALMVIFAIVSWVLRLKTLAPDIFGYVSSLTRENPHMNIPDGGTSLSGFERARLMKNVKLRIADVATETNVGRVGVAAPNAPAQSISTLEKSKVYL